MEILGDVFGQPCALQTEPGEGPQTVEFLRLRANAVLPSGIEAVHVADGELVDIKVVSPFAVSLELIAEGLYLRYLASAMLRFLQ